MVPASIANFLRTTGKVKQEQISRGHWRANFGSMVALPPPLWALCESFKRARGVKSLRVAGGERLFDLRCSAAHACALSRDRRLPGNLWEAHIDRVLTGVSKERRIALKIVA